jgi:hypothetical protein
LRIYEPPLNECDLKVLVLKIVEKVNLLGDEILLLNLLLPLVIEMSTSRKVIHIQNSKRKESENWSIKGDCKMSLVKAITIGTMKAEPKLYD